MSTDEKLGLPLAPLVLLAPGDEAPEAPLEAPPALLLPEVPPELLLPLVLGVELLPAALGVELLPEDPPEALLPVDPPEALLEGLSVALAPLEPDAPLAPEEPEVWALATFARAKSAAAVATATVLNTIWNSS